jgi:hypothetical protein
MINVIGISGKAGVGKDFITNKYLQPRKYFTFSLAWHFKVWLVGKGLATYEEVFVTKPPHVRKLLQEEGTERGRMAFGEDIWCNTIFTWFKVLHDYSGINDFVIPDVRFPNEVDFIKSHGGRVIRIHAPIRAEGNSLTPEARQHISETALDGYDKFDAYLFNDPVYISDIQDQLIEILIKFALTKDPIPPRYSLT